MVEQWDISVILCQKQISRAGTSNNIPQTLWDVITCSCPWYLLLAQRYSYQAPEYYSLPISPKGISCIKLLDSAYLFTQVQTVARQVGFPDEVHISCLVQDCGNSSALAVELLQFVLSDRYYLGLLHYDDIAMGAMASQITSLKIVYSTVYSGADQRKHQSSASQAFVQGFQRGLVNSPHKWPVTWKMFPLIMSSCIWDCLT